jgi:hypothetical protein
VDGCYEALSSGTGRTVEPKSFSATAFNVAELCLARYKAEHIDRSKGFGGTAANLGTAVHGALESYVKLVHLDKQGAESEKILLDFFRLSYMQTFNTSETNTIEYLEGVQMLKAWFKRTDFSKFEVISCEVKENFPIKTSIGEIPFNFIWDRHDRLDDGVYRVVDYKTNRWGLNPSDLKKKIQARAYGVAAQIKYPDAQRIWVQFDMLRHDGPVGIVFTRDDNIATWNFMKAKAEQIIATPDTDVPETLNPECLFCSRITSCSALLKNVSIGGVLSMPKIGDMIDKRAELEWQKKAVESALSKLDEVIIGRARVEDQLEFESDMNRLRIGISATRAIDAERAEHVLPPEVANRYMGKSLTIGNVDKLLKGPELSEEQKSQLVSLIYMKRGEPRVKIEPKNPIDD